MNQALHIFRKDVRYLWYQILVVLALQAASVVFSIRSLPYWTPQTSTINTLTGIVIFVLWVARWYLMALVIHAEALPGDRQFWLTRPYDRRSLIAAKLLFIAVFINLPLFVSDCVIVGAQGFPTVAYIPEMLLRQLPLTLFIVIPAVVFAVVTAALGQYLLAWFLAVVLFIGIATLSSHGRPSFVMNLAASNWVSEWMAIVLALAMGLAFVAWQYSTRRTIPARIVLGALLPMLPFVPGLLGNVPRVPIVNDRTPRPIDTSAIQVAFSPTHDRSIVGQNSIQDWSIVHLPAEVTGLPPDTEVIGGALRMQMQAASGNSRELTSGGVRLERQPGGYSLMLFLNRAEMEHLAPQTISLRMPLDLTAVRVAARATLPAGTETSVDVPDFGRCREAHPMADMPGLYCLTAIWGPQQTRIELQDDKVEATTDWYGNFDSPFPLIMTPDPVQKWFVIFGAESQKVQIGVSHPGAHFVFRPKYPVGSFQRTVEIRNIRLADYGAISR